MSKLPVQDGALVPVYIADGTNDQITRCAATEPQENALPNPKDCLSHAFYDAMKEQAYCPADEAAAGYLKLDLWQQDSKTTSADHFAVPGMAAAHSLDDPRFEGSPLQAFMSDAFDQKLKPQCVPPSS